MRCETLELLLEEYVQNALPNEEKQIVESHLVGCSSCRSLIDQYRELTGGLSDSLASIKIPTCLDQVIQEKVESLHKKHRSRRLWKQGLAIVASFLVLIMGSYHFLPTISRVATTMTQKIEQVLDGNFGIQVAGRGNYRPEEGKSQTIDGITMEIAHIIADSGKVVIMFRISAEEKWYKQYGENAVIRPQDLQVIGSSVAVVDGNRSNVDFSHGGEQNLSYQNMEHGGILGSLVINRGNLGNRITISTGVALDYFQGGSESTLPTLREMQLGPRFEFHIDLDSKMIVN